MLINNIDIKTKYNAILNEKKISSSKTNLNLEWLKGALTPICLDEETNFCSIECKFTFEANSENEFTFKFSEFSKDIAKCILKFDNINMLYKSYIQDVKEPIRISLYNWEFTCKWIGYKFTNEITVNMNREKTKTINIEGNIKTPCILEIIPTIEMIDLTINGVANDPIIIKNLKQGKKIILNGEEGTVTECGINKFKDTDFWEFPFLLPGINNIKVDKDTCNINIKYKNRYK